MPTIDNFIYEVDEKNAVRIWNIESVDGPPQIFQPDYPDGTAFESAESADTWAKEYIGTLIDPVNNDHYLFGPSLPRPERLTQEQVDAIIAAREAELEVSVVEQTE
jgi:hypothetical protein